jgi:endonuclease YncB( thermonuclease family)
LPSFVRLVALAGCVAAYKLQAHDPVVPRGFDLAGRVTHVRDGDTIEVGGVPMQTANLDCAELGAAGDQATAAMRRWAAMERPPSCRRTGHVGGDRRRHGTGDRAAGRSGADG